MAAFAVPIPDGRAEEAARDFANDCRALIRQAIPMQQALTRGELNEQQKNDYIILENQIRSYMDIVFVDPETEEQFRVGDFITPKTEKDAKKRRALWYRAFQKLNRVLH